jgi:hypothetical protein
MATDLWPIIHRLSSLPSLQRLLHAATSSPNPLKAAVYRTELDSTSAAIEHALTTWTPCIPLPSTAPDDATSTSLRSILNNAEAYRQAALVYLYHDIQELPRAAQKVQRHVRLALLACAQVVRWAGPMSALLWPMFVGACGAVREEDRGLARETFAALDR